VASVYQRARPGPGCGKPLSFLDKGLGRLNAVDTVTSESGATGGAQGPGRVNPPIDPRPRHGFV